MRRISRIAFTMVTCSNEYDAQFDRFVKKKIEVPVSSNQTLVIVDSSEYEKGYSVREQFNYLNSDHQDTTSIRTICPINNLSQLKNLKSLSHPYLFNPFNKDFAQQIDEVRYLMENDQLEDLSVEMRYEGGQAGSAVLEYQKIMHLFKQS